MFQGPGAIDELNALPTLQPELLLFLCPLLPYRGIPECGPNLRLIEISTVKGAAEIN